MTCLSPDRRANTAVRFNRVAGPIALRIGQIVATGKSHRHNLVAIFAGQQPSQSGHGLEVAAAVVHYYEAGLAAVRSYSNAHVASDVASTSS